MTKVTNRREFIAKSCKHSRTMVTVSAHKITAISLTQGHRGECCFRYWRLGNQYIKRKWIKYCKKAVILVLHHRRSLAATIKSFKAFSWYEYPEFIKSSLLLLIRMQNSMLLSKAKKCLQCVGTYVVAIMSYNVLFSMLACFLPLCTPFKKQTDFQPVWNILTCVVFLDRRHNSVGMEHQ